MDLPQQLQYSGAISVPHWRALVVLRFRTGLFRSRVTGRLEDSAVQNQRNYTCAAQSYLSYLFYSHDPVWPVFYLCAPSCQPDLCNYPFFRSYTRVTESFRQDFGFFGIRGLQTL